MTDEKPRRTGYPQARRRGQRRRGDGERDRAPRQLGGKIEAVARRAGADSDRAPLLAVDDLSVHYGKAQAQDKVNITVRDGEFASVVGLNGAGKTTLFNAISGLVPYQGTIRFGRDELRPQ